MFHECDITEIFLLQKKGCSSKIQLCRSFTFNKNLPLVNDLKECEFFIRCRQRAIITT